MTNLDNLSNLDVWRAVCSNQVSYEEFEQWLTKKHTTQTHHQTKRSQYTVQKIKDFPLESLYGRIHACEDGYTTVCGHTLNHRWLILTNNYNGEFDCPKCITTLNLI